MLRFYQHLSTGLCSHNEHILYAMDFSSTISYIYIHGRSSDNDIDISALTALNTEEYRKFIVRRVEIVAPDTKKILLDLPSDTVLGTWPVSTVSARATVEGEEVEKQYAPVSPWNSVYAELVVQHGVIARL